LNSIIWQNKARTSILLIS